MVGEIKEKKTIEIIITIANILLSFVQETQSLNFSVALHIRPKRIISREQN